MSDTMEIIRDITGQAKDPESREIFKFAARIIAQNQEQLKELKPGTPEYEAILAKIRDVYKTFGFDPDVTDHVTAARTAFEKIAKAEKTPDEIKAAAKKLAESLPKAPKASMAATSAAGKTGKGILDIKMWALNKAKKSDLARGLERKPPEELIRMLPKNELAGAAVLYERLGGDVPEQVLREIARQEITPEEMAQGRKVLLTGILRKISSGKGAEIAQGMGSESTFADFIRHAVKNLPADPSKTLDLSRVHYNDLKSMAVSLGIDFHGTPKKEELVRRIYEKLGTRQIPRILLRTTKTVKQAQVQQPPKQPPAEEPAAIKESQQATTSEKSKTVSPKASGHTAPGEKPSPQTTAKNPNAPVPQTEKNMDTISNKLQSVLRRAAAGNPRQNVLDEAVAEIVASAPTVTKSAVPSSEALIIVPQAATSIEEVIRPSIAEGALRNASSSYVVIPAEQVLRRAAGATTKPKVVQYLASPAGHFARNTAAGTSAPVKQIVAIVQTPRVRTSINTLQPVANESLLKNAYSKYLVTPAGQLLTKAPVSGSVGTTAGKVLTNVVKEVGTGSGTGATAGEMLTSAEKLVTKTGVGKLAPKLTSMLKGKTGKAALATLALALIAYLATRGFSQKQEQPLIIPEELANQPPPGPTATDIENYIRGLAAQRMMVPVWQSPYEYVLR